EFRRVLFRSSTPIRDAVTRPWPSFENVASRRTRCGRSSCLVSRSGSLGLFGTQTIAPRVTKPPTRIIRPVLPRDFVELLTRHPSYVSGVMHHAPEQRDAPRPRSRLLVHGSLARQTPRASPSLSSTSRRQESNPRYPAHQAGARTNACH